MSADHGQSRTTSMIETALNTVIGFVVAILSQMIVFPLVGVANIPLSTNIEIGAYFTVISIARSYVIRRVFNKWHHRNSTTNNP